MSLQLRLRDTWLPRLFSRFLAASFRWNVPSSCRRKKIKDPYKKQTGCEHERTAANLDGEDEHSTTSHHVEEEDHSFILMRRVGVEDPLGHHVTLIDAQHRRQVSDVNQRIFMSFNVSTSVLEHKHSL